jgi:hypothetical protein
MDLQSIRKDIGKIIGENSQSLVIRRGTTTLPAQTVRVERKGNATLIRQDGSESTIASVTVLGDTTLDIQADDRFTLNGQLYEVKFVRPNQQVCVQAEAILKQ